MDADGLDVGGEEYERKACYGAKYGRVDEECTFLDDIPMLDTACWLLCWVENGLKRQKML